MFGYKLPYASIISILWVLTWALSFNTSMSFAKLLSNDISTFMIVYMRLIFGLLYFTPFIIKYGLNSLSTKRLPFHLFRVVLMCSSMICTYYAYSHLSLTFATSIGFTAPFITTMLAVMVLGDRVVWGQWGLVALGHIGVLIMMRPGSENFDPAIIVALFANFFASAAIIIVKKLSTTESTLQILFYTNVVSVLLMSILAGFLWETPSQHDLIILCVIGATGTFSQFCYIQSLKLSDPSFVAPFEYSRLVFAIPIGLIFFAEIPTNWDIAGSFVIISSNFLLTLFKLKREK